MNRNRAVVLLTAATIAAGAVPAEPDSYVIYANSFAQPGQALRPDFVQSAAGDGVTLAARTGIAPTDGRQGGPCFFFEAKLMKDGYCYPYFRLPEPVALGEGPVYLSGYVKFQEQDPETSHLPGLALYLRAGTKAATVRFGGPVQVHEMEDGWYYLYTDDLSAHLTDRVATGVMVRIWAGRAGETLRVLLDDLRLTRTLPLPVPSRAAFEAKLDLYRRVESEWRTEPAEPVDPALRRKVADGLAGVATLLADTGVDEARRSAIFMGLMTALEKDYWRYKVLEICLAQPATPGTAP